MQIGKQIAQQAKHFDICKEWHGDLKSTKDKDTLVQMYLKGIDFCIKHDFPPLQFIRDNFTGVMEKYGIYVDANFLAKQIKKVVALGESNGSVEIDDYGVCEIFVRHTSRVSIEASGDAFVMVNVYDQGQAKISASDRAKVCIHNHNATVNYQQSGNARVKLVNKIK